MPSVLRLLLSILVLSLALPAGAQTWPSQPIRLIAPFPPGGSVDITARLIGEPLGAQLGTRIIIDNRSGASGNIGMEAAARAPARAAGDCGRVNRIEPRRAVVGA